MENLVGILHSLRNVFEAVWKSEDVPSDWRKRIITIIPKKGALSIVVTTEAAAYAQLHPSCFKLCCYKDLTLDWRIF
jgi:hypothetical protein